MAHPAIKAVSSFFNNNPRIRGLKNLRNQMVDGYFRSRCRERGRQLAGRLDIGPGQGVCMAIAFNTPWVIDILTAAWQRYATGATLVVADNSSDAGCRDEIEQICRARKVAYVALPRNPEWSPNRSHGIALNWMTHNVVRHLRADFFGFIDHDCFPIAPVDFAALLAGRNVYGVANTSPRLDGVWSLWAGLCLFRAAAVEGLALDFKHRYELGLDTGGGNWPVLYSRLSPDQVGFAQPTESTFRLGDIDVWQRFFDGRFLHLEGASYRDAYGKAAYRRLCSDYLWDTYLGGRGDRVAPPNA